MTLLDDGTVWTAAAEKEAVRVAGLTDVVAVGAGSIHGLALRADGTIWAWGLRREDGGITTSATLIGHIGDLPVSPPSLQAALAIPAPELLHFGNQRVGCRGPVRSLLITNLGQEPLHIQRVELGGPHAGDFALAGEDFSGVLIYPGSSCTVAVRFAPGGPGWRRAVLTVRDNGLGSPWSADLSGYGQAASLAESSGGVSLHCRSLAALDLRARGSHGTPTLACGRRKMVETPGGGRRLRQEFLLSLPVGVEVQARCSQADPLLETEHRFTAVQAIWVELPLDSPADAGAGETECAFLVRQRVQVAVPVTFSARTDLLTSHLTGRGGS